MSDDPTTIAPYLRAHLAGASAGIWLFGRSRQADPAMRALATAIRDELVEERAFLRRLASGLDVREVRLVGVAARAALTLSLVTFRGPGPRRTALADVAELETMRDAVAGKIAGWQALLCVADALPCSRDELDRLLAQGERQHDRLAEAHARVCARDLRV